MKAITANLLRDGAVVYLGSNNQWKHEFSSAAYYNDDEAKSILADMMKSSALEVADLYLIDVDEDGAHAGRQVVREAIRSAGPTVRKDLGYQTGARA